MSKKEKKQTVKSINTDNLSIDKTTTINRICTNRQAICKEKKQIVSEKRIDKNRIRKNIININSFDVTSQAQLIDLIIRSNKALTLEAIAIECMKHKDCNAVFEKTYNTDRNINKSHYSIVLDRVKRHNNKDFDIRVIKRNSYHV